MKVSKIVGLAASMALTEYFPEGLDPEDVAEIWEKAEQESDSSIGASIDGQCQARELCT